LCRARISRLAPALMHIINTAAAANRSEPARKLLAEGNEVQCLVDCLCLSIDTQGSSGNIQLALIHDDVLPNPTCSSTGSPSTRPPD
jgi:hypothetical protein